MLFVGSIRSSVSFVPFGDVVESGEEEGEEVLCAERGIKCLWASGETGHFAGSPSGVVMGTAGCPSGIAGASLGRKCLNVEWSTGHFDGVAADSPAVLCGSRVGDIVVLLCGLVEGMEVIRSRKSF